MKSFLKYLLRLIALACVMTAVLACWESGVLPRVVFGELYEGCVWIHIPPPRPRLMTDTPTSGEHFYSTRDLSHPQIYGMLVLDTALQQPGIAQLDCLKREPDKKAWLIKHLEIDYPASDLIKVSITGKDPDELTQLLYAVRLAYLDRVVAVNGEIDMRRYMLLQQKYKETEAELTDKKVRLKGLAEQLGVPDPETAKAAFACALETVEKLRSEDERLQTKINGMERKHALLKGRTTHMEPTEEFRKEIEQSEADRKLYQSQREANAEPLQQATARLENFSRTVGGMTALREEIASLQKTYDRMDEQLTGWESEPVTRGAIPEMPVVKRVR